MTDSGAVQEEPERNHRGTREGQEKNQEEPERNQEEPQRNQRGKRGASDWSKSKQRNRKGLY